MTQVLLRRINMPSRPFARYVISATRAPDTHVTEINCDSDDAGFADGLATRTSTIKYGSLRGVPVAAENKHTLSPFGTLDSFWTMRSQRSIRRGKGLYIAVWTMTIRFYGLTFIHLGLDDVDFPNSIKSSNCRCRLAIGSIIDTYLVDAPNKKKKTKKNIFI